MFWDSYRLEVVTTDPDPRQRLQSVEFWAAAKSEGLLWRSREFGEVADGAFPALSPFQEPGRLTMRRLYLSIGDPWPWDWLVLWWRRCWIQQLAVAGNSLPRDSRSVTTRSPH